jgi:hypothetical protein
MEDIIMNGHTDLGRYTYDSLRRSFELVPENLGGDARLSRRGMTFETQSWEIRGMGHLCVMRMNAFFGLMKMETVVIAPFEADLPLYNADWVKAFGTETQIAEFYDTQLAPWPEKAQEKFLEIRDAFADLPDAPSGVHWYDSLLYPCSVHKKGKGLTDRFNQMAKDYTDLYAANLSAAEKCPADQKKARVSEFAHKLADNDGPAVSMMAKLFGKETMQRMVLRRMYGVEI